MSFRHRLLILGLVAAVTELNTEILATEDSPEMEKARLDFLAKYPAADVDGDGILTPSEVWHFRQVSFKNRERAKFQDANRLMQATYNPSPIDETEIYGAKPGKRIKLFIISGQSNVAGQGLSAELSPEMLVSDPGILMFEGGKWQPLQPLTYKFGPEIAFGQAMAKAWPDETIGIVKQARGGTGILAWHPNWTKEQADRTNDGGKGNLWKELTDKVRKARDSADCELMAFVWLQGGADTQRLDVAKEYGDNLQALVQGLRKETNEPNLPIVLGSVRVDGMPDDLSGVVLEDLEFDVPQDRAGVWYVVKAQYDAQTEVAPAKMVPLRNLEQHPENIHYNTNGQLELGRLFAEGYLGFLHEQNLTAKTLEPGDGRSKEE